MKNLVQSQPEQVASSTAKKPQYPILWVSDFIDASNSYLSGLFDIRGFEEIGDYIATDAQHYIVDTGASEEIIKAIAWTVGECSIWHCESKLPLSYLAPDHATSIEVFDNIFNHSNKIEDWLKATNQESNKLQHQDAVNLAQVAIKLLKGSQKTKELDILRRRCNENPFNWNNLMKELENEFIEELERRDIAAKQQTRRDRLRLELLALSEETDILAWDDTLNDIAQRYGKKVSRLESMLVQLIDSTSKPQARRLTSQEFYAAKTSDVEWLVPGLMPATGVTLMVANPGVGKTTLGYDLAASVIYNEEFLGENPLKTGKVIFVNSFGEMSDNEMLSSFIDRRIGVSDKYELLLDWDMTQLPKLQKMIEELQPTLIVIDSYRGITGYLPHFDENNSKAGLPIRRLQSLCNQYKTAMLVIHHNNKSQVYEEIAKSAGNFSIAASSSAVWQLDKDLVSNTIKLSTAKIRGAERRELKITLDGFDRHFDVISDSAKQNEQQ
jgi:AAA domain